MKQNMNEWRDKKYDKRKKKQKYDDKESSRIYENWWIIEKNACKQADGCWYE